MKASKILVSVLLLLAMCASLLSVAAFADGAVAQVEGAGGKTEKSSLADAVSAASAGDKVRLLQDCSLSAALVIDRDLTLDLGGNELSFTSSRMPPLSSRAAKSLSETAPSAFSPKPTKAVIVSAS